MNPATRPRPKAVSPLSLLTLYRLPSQCSNEALRVACCPGIRPIDEALILGDSSIPHSLMESQFRSTISSLLDRSHQS
jgi:hypothetical protein